MNVKIPTFDTPSYGCAGQAPMMMFKDYIIHSDARRNREAQWKNQEYMNIKPLAGVEQRANFEKVKESTFTYRNAQAPQS